MMTSSMASNVAEKREAGASLVEVVTAVDEAAGMYINEIYKDIPLDEYTLHENGVIVACMTASLTDAFDRGSSP